MNDGVPLRDYVERHWSEHQREHDEGQRALDDRLHVLNELRAGVITRDEYQVRHDALETALNVLRERVTIIEGRSRGLNAGWGYIVGAAGIAGAVVAIFVLLHG